MSPELSRVLEQALRLSEEERAELIDHLTLSLDQVPDEEVEAAWSAEIQKRLDDIEQGRVELIPWPEARRMIMEEDDAAPGS
jgi:putative addiction module component (TIGR02574 family)